MVGYTFRVGEYVVLSKGGRGELSLYAIVEFQQWGDSVNLVEVMTSKSAAKQRTSHVASLWWYGPFAGWRELNGFVDCLSQRAWWSFVVYHSEEKTRPAYSDVLKPGDYMELAFCLQKRACEVLGPFESEGEAREASQRLWREAA